MRFNKRWLAVLIVMVATAVVPMVVLAATAPSISVVVTPASPNGNNGWYTTGTVTVDWTVTGDPAPTVTGCDDFDVTIDQPATPYTCTATNGEPPDATVTVTIKRDATKPTITATPVGTSGSNGWYTSNVMIDFICADATSGIATCPSGDVLMDGATLFSTARTATDNAGNVSVASNVVGPLFIDTVAPQMIAILSPTPTSFGWNNTDVDVSFGCTDAGSGVDLPLSSGVGGDGTATAEGDTPFTGTGTCYDYAGNTGTPVSVTVKIDKTAPNVNCTAPAPATYSTDVVVPCVAQDNAGGSGLAVAGDSNFSLSTSGPGTNLSTTSRSVCDKAGNCVPAGPFGPYTIDGTGPSVTLSVTDGTLGTNGWYTSDVTVHTAGTDDVLPVTCTADQFQTTDTTGATFNGSCTNGAAITTNATPLTVKLDKTKPVLDPSLPVNPVALNAVVDADPNASDATSGIASSSCEDVDTSVAGTFEIDCTAKDNAGNTQTKTISYTVLAQSTGSGGILFGNKPPLGGGYGTFAFGGGTFEQLLATSGCPSVSAVFFYNKPDGAFAVWIPGTTVSLVNQEIIGIFSATIPSGTIFTARCV